MDGLFVLINGEGRVDHAGLFLGRCWGLMALFVAFGVLNLWAMLALAAMVVGGKSAHHGETVGRSCSQPPQMDLVA